MRSYPYDVLQSLILKSHPVNIAYLGPKDELYRWFEKWGEEKGLQTVYLNELPLRKWPHLGEYFEAILINEPFIDEPKKIKQLKKGLLKNQHLIYLDETEDEAKLKEVLEPWGFSDICMIKGEDLPLGYNVTIYLIKKWFTFEQ